MSGEVQAAEKKKKTDQIVRALINESYGVLATTGDTGLPYAVPFHYIYEDSAIYIFSTSSAGRMYDNLKNNNKVCFTIVKKMKVSQNQKKLKYHSMVIDGTIVRITDEKKKRIKKSFEEKYGDKICMQEEYMNKTDAYRINISSLSEKEWQTQ